MSESAQLDPDRYEKMYRDQQVVKQLVALGAIKGEVLDPGTGPGHHAIYFASKGYSTTGIDSSPAAIERAKENARIAGVSVDFQVADASRLEGLDNRFDTVVDCAFYHVFSDVPDASRSYAQALHRATRPGARLYMFEFAPGGVNGIGAPRSLSEDNFRQVFPDAGWEITYLEPSTYQVNMSMTAFEAMLERNPDKLEEIKHAALRFALIEPTLDKGRAHAPVWEMHATRID